MGAIEQALRVFCVLGRVVSIQALYGPRKAVSRCTGDLAEAARIAAELDGTNPLGVYFGLNPSRPDFDGTSAFPKNEDITRRHWLPIDVDPDRPTGTSSTEAELADAWLVLDRCRGTLDGCGLMGAVVGCSGNGWHLCYPIDLPNDEASQELVKAVLKGLQSRCGGLVAKVDTACHDAKRIWKMYGTRARKGEASPERPHRWAFLAEGEPWASQTAAANTALLQPILDRWRYIDDSRKGRPTGDLIARAKAYLAKVDPAIAGKPANPPDNMNYGHDQTFHAACVLVEGFGLDRAQALEAIQEWNRRCVPPWDRKDLLHKIDDAIGKIDPAKLRSMLTGPPGTNGQAPVPPVVEPWEQPIPLEDDEAPQPFPLDVLPAGLRRFVEEGAWALNCPPDFIAIPLLVAAGSCVGNSTRLRITRTHTQGAVLFAGIVGLASSGKSPALELILDPLEDAQQRFYEEWQTVKEAAEVDREDGIAVDPSTIPPLRQLLVNEATTEAIARMLQPNPRGAFMPLDEVAALVSGLDQYKAGGKGNDRQFYLRLWPQATIRVHRVKHEDGIPLVVRRPFVGIVGGIQPSVIHSMRAQQERGHGPVEDGFLDRWLWGYPAPLPAVGETWREVSEEASGAWGAAVRHLLELPPAEELENVYDPRYLNLSASAKLVWQTFTNDHAAELNDPEFPPHLIGPWGKFRGYCGRLALILHLIWEASGSSEEEHRASVSGKILQRAVSLINYFKSHARRVYKALGTDPRIADARKVLSWIRGQDVESISRRDLWRGLRYQFGKPEDLTAPLGLLQQLHYLRRVELPKGATGRPASPMFQINPLFLRTEDTKDKT